MYLSLSGALGPDFLEPVTLAAVVGIREALELEVIEAELRVLGVLAPVNVLALLEALRLQAQVRILVAIVDQTMPVWLGRKAYIHRLLRIELK